MPKTQFQLDFERDMRDPEFRAAFRAAFQRAKKLMAADDREGLVDLLLKRGEWICD